MKLPHRKKKKKKKPENLSIWPTRFANRRLSQYKQSNFSSLWPKLKLNSTWARDWAWTLTLCIQIKMDNILYGNLAHVSEICNGTIILDLSCPKEKWQRQRERERDRQKFWPAYKQKVESFVKSLQRLGMSQWIWPGFATTVNNIWPKKKVKPARYGEWPYEFTS